MKIMQINTVYKQGSTGTIVASISKKCRNKGFDSIVIYGVGKQIREKGVYKIETLLGYYAHNIFSRFFCSQGEHSYAATLKLLWKIKSFHPDIIHIHNLHGNYINYKLLFRLIKKLEIKIVWTFHDCWPFTGKCTHFDFVNCMKWKQQCESCIQLKEYPKSFFLDSSRRSYLRKKKVFSSHNSLVVVTPSEWLEDKAKKSFFNKYEILTINNGVDLSIFRPMQSNLKSTLGIEDKFVILSIVDNFSGRKGGEFILELSKIIDDRMRILVVGVSKIIDVSNNIIFHKKIIDKSEMAKIYSLADVFVNPTLEDTFPTVNIESISCGTPVVTFPTGGSPEIIDERTGIVTKECNADNIYNAILEICKNGKETYTLNCRKRAELLYDKEKKYNKYIELYSILFNESCH